MKLFSYHYKDRTIETTKCSNKKRRQNFWGREHSFKLKKEKKEEEIMNSLMLKKHNIIKDLRNLFRLRKEINDNEKKKKIKKKEKRK